MKSQFKTRKGNTMNENTSKLTSQAAKTKVTEIMTRSVNTVQPNDSVQTVLRLMVEGVNTLPVVNDAGKCIGMISRADLSESLFAEDQELARLVETAGTGSAMNSPSAIDTCTERRVYELMSDQVQVANFATDIRSACQMLTAGNFHHLPIEDDSEKLIGIVSTSDVIRWLSN